MSLSVSVFSPKAHYTSVAVNTPRAAAITESLRGASVGSALAERSSARASGSNVLPVPVGPGLPGLNSFTSQPEITRVQNGV